MPRGSHGSGSAAGTHSHSDTASDVGRSLAGRSLTRGMCGDHALDPSRRLTLDHRRAIYTSVSIVIWSSEGREWSTRCPDRRFLTRRPRYFAASTALRLQTTTIGLVLDCQAVCPGRQLLVHGRHVLHGLIGKQAIVLYREPECCKHYFLREMPEKYHSMVDVPAFGRVSA
jgi:hypothetical protein